MIHYPFDLYAKQRPKPKNAPDIVAQPLDFNDHPSYNILMTGDSTPTSMLGREGVHGHLVIKDNASGNELNLGSIPGAKCNGSTLSELATLTTTMSDNAERILIAVYFDANNAPIFTPTGIIS